MLDSTTSVFRPSDTLSLLTWNVRCNPSLWTVIERASPDIAVVQECPRPEELMTQLPGFADRWTCFWDGRARSGRWNTQGLLVAVRVGLPARLHSPADPKIKFALAVEIDVPIPLHLLGVHSYNDRAIDLGGSPTPLPDALAAHRVWLAETRSVVAGDFNNTPSFEPYCTGRNRPNSFARIRESIEALGLLSAWHALNGEAFGAESRMTHFRAGGDHHIDYIWASSELLARASCTIYDRDDPRWRPGSDHAPVWFRTRISSRA